MPQFIRIKRNDGFLIKRIGITLIQFKPIDNPDPRRFNVHKYRNIPLNLALITDGPAKAAILICDH